MFDVLIKGGRVVDGTGAAAYAGAVAVKDGRIAAVGDVQGEARTVVDAKGQVIKPAEPAKDAEPAAPAKPAAASRGGLFDGFAQVHQHDHAG